MNGDSKYRNVDLSISLDRVILPDRCREIFLQLIKKIHQQIGFMKLRIK